MKHVVLALTFTLTNGPTYSKENPETKKLFGGIYLEMKSAMASRDSSKVAQLLAPGFESIDVSGTSESAGQMVKAVASLPVDSTKKSQTTLLSVQEKGDSAFVEQKYFMTKTKLGQGAESQRIELTTISKDTWVKHNGKWLVLKTETKSMDYKINGKTVAHKER